MESIAYLDQNLIFTFSFFPSFAKCASADSGVFPELSFRHSPVDQKLPQLLIGYNHYIFSKMKHV